LSEPRTQRSGVSGAAPRSGRCTAGIFHHPLWPIESWVVEDEAISERDRLPRGRHRSGSKLGPLRDRRSAVRI